MSTIAQDTTVKSTGPFLFDEKNNIELECDVDNMTKMVWDNDFVGNFKKSAFGHYFNASFYDQSKSSSKFEKVASVYAFTILIVFNFTDINFDIENNAMAEYAMQYKEIADIEGLSFIFECSFHDANLTQVKNSEDVYIEIVSSTTKGTKEYNIVDVTDIEKLNGKLWNSPDYCTNVRERVLYFIFEDDYILRKYEVSLETVVKDYKGTQQFINDFLLVEEMNKI